MNGIQRKVLQTLDDRLNSIEMDGAKKLFDDLSYRVVNSEIKIEKLVSTTEDVTNRHEKVRTIVEQHSINHKELLSDLKKFISDTVSSIKAHEKLLEGLEKRLRVVEVPLEDNTARFEKVESQTIALKYPIKDIYDKLDAIDSAKESDKKELDEKITQMTKTIEKFDE